MFLLVLIIVLNVLFRIFLKFFIFGQECSKNNPDKNIVEKNTLDKKILEYPRCEYPWWKYPI